MTSRGGGGVRALDARLVAGASASRAAAYVLVVLVVLAGVSVIARDGVWAGSGGAHGHAVVGRSSRFLEREAASAARVPEQALAHQRWLGSPAVVAARRMSRLAFAGMSAGSAKGLLVRNFGSAVRAASAAPSVRQVTGAPVVRYLGAREVEVRGPQGPQFVHSIFPLAHPVGGRERPVDLRLRSTPVGYVPVNAVHPVEIGRRLAMGVGLGGGVRVSMVGRDAQAVAVGASAVFFGNVARDVDATAAVSPRGVELFATLRSIASPQELRYRFVLPAGAVLRSVHGEAEVLRGGRVLATVLPPSARDAQGQSVPVTSSVAGDELVLHVAHRGGSFAYPILVDPVVNQEKGAPGWTFQEGHWITEKGESKFVVDPEGNYVAREDGGIEAPSGLAYNNPEYRVGSRWLWAAPAGTVISHVSFEGTETYTPHAEYSEQQFYGTVGAGEKCGESVVSGETKRFTVTPECVGSATSLGIYYFSENLKSVTKHKANLYIDVAWVTEARRHGNNSYGPTNPGEPEVPRVSCGSPVNCATGNDFYSQTDLSIGGKPGLNLTRTYNSQLAATQTSPGPFGYGWSASYGAYLSIESVDCGKESLYFSCTEQVTVHQANGSAETFEEAGGSPRQFAAQGPWVQASLRERVSGEFEYTLPGGSRILFSSKGREESETDTSGNTTSLTYNESGQLTKAEESAGRSISFAFNSEGLVKEAKDSLGTVLYTYTSKNLTEVTDLAKHKWKFAYNSSHELTSQTDPLSHTITTEYNRSFQAIGQTDALERKRTWKYGTSGSGTETTITDPSGAVSVELFNAAALPTSITHAYGTSLASTKTYEYNILNELISVTDANKHTTKYGYDSEGNRTSESDPLGHKTEWTYYPAPSHGVKTVTTPDGEVTTIERDSDNRPVTVSRPTPSGTQTTKYKYDARGDLESVTDPLSRVWKYEYDSYGDRKAEIDPAGDKRTWAYNEASQLTSMVSPRGNVEGGEPAKYTTTYEPDVLGRPTLVREAGSAGTGEPVDKTSSSITGSPQEGQTLSANTGVWAGATPLGYTYQWRHCNTSGESCTSISGATSATYAVTHTDSGYTIRVVVTATNTSGSASSTSAATAVVSAPVPVFFAKFGVHGSGESELAGAKGIALDGKGDVIVSDELSAKVKVFKENGEFVKAFGSYGTGAEQIAEIKGIAVDSKGNIWVADQGNSRIAEYSESGKWEGSIGSAGTGAKEFKEVKGVAVDSKGNVWVADTGNNRIQKFNEKRELVGVYGWGVSSGEEKFQTCTASCHPGNAGTGHGQFSKPRTLAADAAGNVWVTDTGNNRVEEINEKGEYVKAFGTTGSGSGQFNEPIGITVDSHGNVWATDAGNSRVQEFNEAGEYLTQFGSAGSANGQFNEPWSVRVNSHGEVFVSDSANYRIQKFAPSTVEVPLTPTYASKFGSHGSGETEFAAAKGIALDGKGNVVVSDEGNAKVQVFEESGKFVKAFGSYGTGAEQIAEIKGIAVDSKGNIWVADQGNSRIAEYNEKGEWQHTIGAAGTGAGQFKEVKGVAVDSKGNIWVADTGNNRVEKFNEKRELVGVYGWGVSNGEEKFQTCTASCHPGNAGSGHGQFSKPRTLAADAAGNVWVTDTGNNRVEEINEKGEYTRVFGTSGSGNGQFYEPIGITVDAHSNVWVTDAGNSRIEEFNATGEYLTQFGSAGSSEGQFNEPWSVQVNSHGEIFVSDSANYRIQKFADPGTPANTAGSGVSGELLSGQTLHASAGNWTGAATITYSYQWEDCNPSGESCTAIPGATSSTYVLAASDVGDTLCVIVTATSPAGALAATSSATETIVAVHTMQYAYDAAGNLESETDANEHKTKYTYDADNEQTKIEEPNKTITETGYDAEGQVISQTDGNKHKTEYVRNALEELTETIDPLKRKTTREYDKAGNLTKVIDPAKRTTTDTYNEANQLTETSYSDGKTPTVKYEYNGDGKLTHMSDGTGETTNTYDPLDRLTETSNGHKETVKYEYDLANEQTKITYPSSKAITRAYDKAGRLETVTDWLEQTTKFAYDPDSDLTATTFPTGTGDEDTYAYNEADQMRETKISKGAELLASLTYNRDNDGQLKTTTAKGLPGEETTSYEYDANNRLTKGAGLAYEYDAADNPKKEGSATYTYDAASQLETGPSLKYTYNEMGQRTKSTPTTGPATAYGYDQAGNLTTITRPKEGETPAIEDTYAYNGNQIRSSQTIAGSTTYLVWDSAEAVPLLLTDGTNSYIYGPAGLPTEQINNSTGTVTYLHHDQAGSTRLLTSSTGTVTGKCTYGTYGAATCEGATTSPIGYDGQPTGSDTGLIYMRARTYDPSTAQFLSVDPLQKLTRAPYTYAGDNPLNFEDPTGLSWQICVGGTVSVGLFTLGGEACYVSTPGGSGVTGTGSVSLGPGAGANIHVGGGVSNACTPSEYGGVFTQYGGSVTYGLGGYGTVFSNVPVPGSGRAVTGATGGVTYGLNAETGPGISDTGVLPLTENKTPTPCGCVR